MIIIRLRWPESRAPQAPEEAAIHEEAGYPAFAAYRPTRNAASPGGRKHGRPSEFPDGLREIARLLARAGAAKREGRL